MQNTQQSKNNWGGEEGNKTLKHAEIKLNQMIFLNLQTHWNYDCDNVKKSVGDFKVINSLPD